MNGVVAVTAHGQLGLPETSFFLRHGLEVVDTAEPEFKLVCVKLKQDAPAPRFYDSGKRQTKATGLTMSYTAQCPFTQGLVDNFAALTNAQNPEAG